MAKLYFYYSAMNAGKTTTLLQSDHNYHERGLYTLLFTPIVDTRYGIGKIASRIGLEKQAVAFSPEFNFYNYVQQTLKTLPHPIHCILCDEAQFLTKNQVLEFTRIVDQFKIPILTYGLRTDFRGEPFSGSQYLLAWADELIEIKGICHCGKKATMTLKLDQTGQPTQTGEAIDIGGNEKYVSVCRKHFFEKHKHWIKPQLETMGVSSFALQE